MNRNYTLLILGTLLIFYTACQKDSKVSPNATQTVKPASPTDSTKNNTTDSTKKSTIHATKITDTFRQLPIIYPYTQTATGMMNNSYSWQYSIYQDASNSGFVFYIRHINRDSIKFTSQWCDGFDFGNNITAAFGVNNTNIYSISFMNKGDANMPASSYNFKIVNDSLYASWYYYTSEGCTDWTVDTGTFAGKIQ